MAFSPINSGQGLSPADKDTIDTVAASLPSLLGMLSSAWVSGCAPTQTSATTIDFAPGVVDINDITDRANPTPKRVSFAGITGLTPDNINTQLITAFAIDIDGNIIQSNDLYKFDTVRPHAVIGSAVHEDLTNISRVNLFTSTLNTNLASTVDDLGNVLGSMNAGGNLISPNGANLKLNLSAGSTFRPGISSYTSTNNNNIVSGGAIEGFPFIQVWRDSVADQYQFIVTDTLRPKRYDDGTGGVVNSPNDGQPNGVVPNRRWTITRVYIERSTGAQLIQYGTDFYTTMADAEAVINSEDFTPAPAFEGSILRCFILIRGNATDLTDPTLAKFIEASKFGDSATSSASTSTATLQSAYNNSPDPELITNTNGPVTFQEGNGNDANNVFEIANNAGQVTFSVDGLGAVIGQSALSVPTGVFSLNVGVGTVTPLASLDVRGEIRTYPTVGDATLRFGVGGVEKGKVAANAAGTLYIETGGSEKFNISAAGKSTFNGSVDIGGPLKLGDYTVLTAPLVSGFNESLILVTNDVTAISAPILAISNGVQWVRVSDQQVISET